MPDLVAALDADVLVPIVTCDFLLTAFDVGLYEPAVSAKALEEVQVALTEDFPHLDPQAVRARVDAMRAALEDHVVEGEPVDVPLGINDKDRHVVGAAIEAEATLIVSNDRRLRAEVNAAELDQRAIDVDEFAMHLWASSPAGVSAVVDAMVYKRRHPPVRRAVIVESLRPSMPRLATELPSN